MNNSKSAADRREELAQWFDAEFEKVTLVGGDNHDEPVDYTPRSIEKITASVKKMSAPKDNNNK